MSSKFFSLLLFCSSFGEADARRAKREDFNSFILIRQSSFHFTVVGTKLFKKLSHQSQNTHTHTVSILGNASISHNNNNKEEKPALYMYVCIHIVHPNTYDTKILTQQIRSMCQIQCFIEHIHFLFIISSHSHFVHL